MFLTMEFLMFLISTFAVYCAAKIDNNGPLMNKLVKVKPVGKHVGRNFVPFTEIPPPHESDLRPHIHIDKNGRRHLIDSDGCTTKHTGKGVYEGGYVGFIADYYDDRVEKTVATVIIPDHIDHKHFQVTESNLYYTVGEIDGIGYHHSTIKSEHPSECEKIYQDHVAEQYSDEPEEYSEESLEMARVPLINKDELHNERLRTLYDFNFSE